jgi:3-methyladenine DNA glycosylase AlkD
MKNVKQLVKDLENLKNTSKSEILGRFFKTGKGEYGEGDVFWGISVPQQRLISKNYYDLSLQDIGELLNHKVHEIRLTAALVLVGKYEKSNNLDVRKKIYQFYYDKLERLNNWDLIDLSVYKILGHYLFHYESKKEAISVLGRLAKSHNLWRRRAAMVATFYFIKSGRYQETFKIANLLISDKHDLIAKAIGWMLREVGKRVSEEVLCLYLNKNYKRLPRVSLRYTIERLDSEKKMKYMK